MAYLMYLGLARALPNSLAVCQADVELLGWNEGRRGIDAGSWVDTQVLLNYLREPNGSVVLGNALSCLPRPRRTLRYTWEPCPPVWPNWTVVLVSEVVSAPAACSCADCHCQL